MSDSHKEMIKPAQDVTVTHLNTPIYTGNFAPALEFPLTTTGTTRTPATHRGLAAPHNASPSFAQFIHHHQNMPYTINDGSLDCYGHNTWGYDAWGFHGVGFNVWGYNVWGYDIWGYDTWGYDAFGYDNGGYDIKGWDRENKDSDGCLKGCLGCAKLDENGGEYSYSSDIAERYAEEGVGYDGVVHCKGCILDTQTSTSTTSVTAPRSSIFRAQIDSITIPANTSAAFDPAAPASLSTHAIIDSTIEPTSTSASKSESTHDSASPDAEDELKKLGRGYDADGYDADGHDDEGYNIKGWNRANRDGDGCLKYCVGCAKFDGNGEYVHGRYGEDEAGVENGRIVRLEGCILALEGREM